MVQIETPFNGAVLNRQHGEQRDTGLSVRVTGRAPLGAAVRVNGIPAERFGEGFAASVLIDTARTPITAEADGPAGAASHRIEVLWDRYSEKRYRFSIDDNSFFLRDIARSGYDSLFECFYLEGLRRLHREYGVKFTVNVFHTTPDGDFTLAQFPDRYRDEWRESASWLKLAFHAYAEFPDRPYQYATAATLANDMDIVEKEIERFAGESTLAPPTVIHWGMCTPACLQLLHSRGVTVLSGFFSRGVDDRYDVNYNLDDVFSDRVDRHGCVMDWRSGMVFSKVHIVCNNTPVADTVAQLRPYVEADCPADVLDLFTHEQYFWPDYRRYVPDHFERLDRAIRYATEQGYRPVFLHEGFLGGERPEDLSA